MEWTVVKSCILCLVVPTVSNAYDNVQCIICIINKVRFNLCIPEHVLPFPLNPSLQVHWKEPSLLVHVAFE